MADTSSPAAGAQGAIQVRYSPRFVTVKGVRPRVYATAIRPHVDSPELAVVKIAAKLQPLCCVPRMDSYNSRYLGFTAVFT